ncbi:hypothetical protein [Ktedonospora formicarum]|uniref:Uncharacterized protein n=1 Tax=Ktedonospora formicarum TaxID=2778364 RepID=A0A8J3MQR3_9CHLR|nr:hypothetical protein [Ktedonospora formicarum]GHO45177.1 hypothetical protein KSX_33400 [Ktedonospora formicarum]
MNVKFLWKSTEQKPQEAVKPADDGMHDNVKATFVNWTATIVPFALGLLLAISNGYFFAGFQDFHPGDVSNFIAWGSGFAIEAATLAAVFNASLRLKAGDKKGFRASLAVGVLLALISFTAQYVFLQMSLANGFLRVNDSAIDKMPLFSMLVGVGGFQGHDVLFLIRASAYHVAEFACTFLIAGKGVTHSKKLELQRQDFESSMAEAQQQMVLSFMKAINENMTAMMASNQKLLSQQFSQVLTGIEQPVPRVELSAAYVTPAPLPQIESPTQTTSELSAAAIAEALAEQAKKERVLWKPQPQPENLSKQGPIE